MTFFEMMQARKEALCDNSDVIALHCTNDARAFDDQMFLSDALDNMSVVEFDLECINLHS